MSTRIPFLPPVVLTLAMLWSPAASAQVAGILGQGLNCNYATIQGAINAASPGATVVVVPGTYQEHLTITKDIILRPATNASCSAASSTARVELLPDHGQSPIVDVQAHRDLTMHRFDVRDGGHLNGANMRVSTGSIVHLHAVTLTGGISRWGGGIFVDGSGAKSEIHLHGSTISDNIAILTGGFPTSGRGGGVYLDGGHELHLHSSSQIGTTDDANFARMGGGVYLNGPTSRLVIHGPPSRVRHGVAWVDGGCVGGDGEVVVDGGSIHDCYAGGDGGAIKADSVTLSGSAQVWDAIAEGDGGGIHARHVLLAGTSQVTDTSAEGDGGGIYATENAVVSAFSEVKSTSAGRHGGSIWSPLVSVGIHGSVRNGSAGLDGGCIYTYDMWTGFSGLVENCTAGRNGGAINARDLEVLQSAIVTGGTAVGAGGLAYIRSNGSLAVAGHAQLLDGEAHSGGLVYLSSGTTATLSGNAELREGAATGSGGLIHQVSGSLTIEDAVALSDGQANGHGGLIYKAAGATTIDHDAQLSHGVSGRDGGLLYLSNGTTTTIGADPTGDGQVVLSHGGARDGGAIALVGSTASLHVDRKTQVHSSSATHGGGIYVSEGAVNLTGEVLIGGLDQGNAASSLGGGLYLNDAATLDVLGAGFDYQMGDDPPQDGIDIAYNTAGSSGAGVYLGGGSTMTAGRVAIFNNVATGSRASGGGLAVIEATANLNYVAVIENEARRGGGAFVRGGALDVVSTLAGDICTGFAFDRHCTEFRLNKSNGGGTVPNEGGAIFAVDGDVALNQVALQKNDAAADASGLAATQESLVDLRNVLVDSRETSVARSVVIQSGSSLDARMSTFAAEGTTVRFDAGTTGTFNGNVIWPGGGAGTGLDVAGAAVTGACNVGLNVAQLGGGNLNADPQLITHSVRGPFRLGPSSPARDLCADDFDQGVDLDRFLRAPNPTGYDVGAYIWRP